MTELDRIYEQRFATRDVATKDRLWAEVGRFLQRFVPVDGAVLDLACDRGYFIRNVRARERWASDVRDVRDALPPDVRFVHGDGLTLDTLLPPATFDLVFMSNYLEHLPSGQSVIDQLAVVHHLLRPGGRVLILQPNIRLVGAAYWNFIDHKVALTDESLVEAAELAGFITCRVIHRFLPYSTKGRLPSYPLLVRGYLAFPPAWWFLGKQTLYLGERPT